MQELLKEISREARKCNLTLQILPVNSGLSMAYTTNRSSYYHYYYKNILNSNFYQNT